MLMAYIKLLGTGGPSASNASNTAWGEVLNSAVEDISAFSPPCGCIKGCHRESAQSRGLVHPCATRRKGHQRGGWTKCHILPCNKNHHREDAQVSLGTSHFFSIQLIRISKDCNLDCTMKSPFNCE